MNIAATQDESHPTGPVCPTCNQPRRILALELLRLNFEDERLEYALCGKCETYLLLSDNPTVQKDVIESTGESYAKLLSDRVQKKLKR